MGISQVENMSDGQLKKKMSLERDENIFLFEELIDNL
jgi:hypothetical protein